MTLSPLVMKQTELAASLNMSRNGQPNSLNKQDDLFTPELVLALDILALLKKQHLKKSKKGFMLVLKAVEQA